MFLVIKSYIQDCFVISDSDADRETKGILEIFEAHGAPPNDMRLIKKQVYKILGERFQWKNLTEKRDIEHQREATILAYNQYIQKRRR